MSEYKCEKCEKCLSSKRALHQHQNKQKPCVDNNDKTKYICNRCLIYVSTKQKLIQHINRKNKCAIYRNIVVIPTDFEKEIELDKQKDKMIIEMKKEYNQQLLKCYKEYNNTSVRIKAKENLSKRLMENLKRLKARKTIPETMFSIIPEEKKINNTSDDLVKYYHTLKTKIEHAENTIMSLQEIHEQTILNVNSILDELVDNREKVMKIRKELKNRCNIHLLSCMYNIEETGKYNNLFILQNK